MTPAQKIDALALEVENIAALYEIALDGMDEIGERFGLEKCDRRGLDLARARLIEIREGA